MKSPPKEFLAHLNVDLNANINPNLNQNLHLNTKLNLDQKPKRTYEFDHK